MRVRIRFAKEGKVRFTSHRDVARIWERALRRVGLPVAYSQGFSPRPKLHFGLALSTGYESTAEYLDVDLEPSAPTVEVDRLTGPLTDALPVGMAALAAAELEPGTPSLQQAVTSCTWRIVVGGAGDEIRAAVNRVRSSPQVWLRRTRKGQETNDDVRPSIVELDVEWTTEHEAELEAELRTQPRGLRPSELIAVLGDRVEERRVRRTHQWIQHDGQRRDVLRRESPDVRAGL
jgi:radical SAM-linked protein